MTTATITPLASGAAVLELHGVVQDFPSWEAAVSYARRHHATPRLLPFPPLPVEVAWTTPELRVLT